MEKEDGYALVNHILKNISLPVGMHTYSNCKNRCMMEDRCKSINMGPEDKDKVLCQISDSDHVQHPNDLKPTEGFTYRGMEVSKKSSVFELANCICSFGNPRRKTHRIAMSIPNGTYE